MEVLVVLMIMVQVQMELLLGVGKEVTPFNIKWWWCKI